MKKENFANLKSLSRETVVMVQKTQTVRNVAAVPINNVSLCGEFGPLLLFLLQCWK